MSETTPLLSRNAFPEITYTQSLANIAKSSFLNVFLVFVPLGIVAGELGWSAGTVFAINFVAIVPLAKFLGLATEDLALRVGQTLGGLLNATFGNAVELIVGIIALKEGLLRVVLASMLGSILSNLLLVLGMCFVAGGLKYKEQTFNQTAALTSGSLLTVTVLSFLLPAAFDGQLLQINDPNREEKVLKLSRWTALVLFVIYIVFLVFQLKTHAYLYDDKIAGPDSDDSTEHYGGPSFSSPRQGVASNGVMEEPEEPQTNFVSACVLLLVATVLVSICAEYLVGSIEGMSKSWGLTQSFVGLVLLPIVGNAAEHLTAVTCALKNKAELAINIGIGSSLQIALCVAPVLVLIGWIIRVPLTLEFSVFETAVAFLSVFIVNGLISDGRSNYLEGILLLGSYFIICVAFYYMP